MRRSMPTVGVAPRPGPGWGTPVPPAFRSPNVLRALGAAVVATALSLSFAGPVRAAEADAGPFISEIHYDDSGATDSGEAIEIEAPVGFDLTGWQIVLYNGSGGGVYGTTTLSGQVPAAGVFVQEYPANGIQNGSPDGVALVNAAGAVTEFLSYEGPLTATAGPAIGTTSVDIGVAEAATTPVGESLQKIGGTWRAPAGRSFGKRNTVAPTPEPDPEPVPGCTVAVDHTIAEVQGTGAATGLAGTKVTVEGVVTADHRVGGYSGVYVQTAGSGGDRPVAAGTASDAVFVFMPAGTAPTVAIGDLVRVSGTANEFNTVTQLSIAAKTDVQVCAHAATLPAPVPLSLPLSDEARESAEAMLVAPVGAFTVSDVYNTNRFGEIILAAGNTPARVPTDVARP